MNLVSNLNFWFPWVLKRVEDWEAAHFIEIDGVPYVEYEALVEEGCCLIVQTVVDQLVSTLLVVSAFIVFTVALYGALDFFWYIWKQKREMKKEQKSSAPADEI